MTDERELEQLVAKMVERGARAHIDYAGTRQIKTITLFDAPGIGCHPMAPLSAAERMRQWLANYGTP